uniref:Uncharacterized protein n=1 Tax=Candidatus Methanophagaceae archaeon ANME-1 ERB6 TaxID=2759912 RepID=A0A7G9YSX7_9EURY|nr:hypothetical protein OLNPMGDC_00002 [Methanosarcinales archaeon ANME-1 ERB6]
MTNNKLEANPEKEFCSDPNCRDYGKRGEGNIVRYGHAKMAGSDLNARHAAESL